MNEIILQGNKCIAQLLHDANIMFAAPCGGHGRCGKCRVVVHGDLSAPSAQEIKLLTHAELTSGVRLACCSFATGTVRVSLPDDSGAHICTDYATSAAFDAPAYQKLGVAIDIGTTTLVAQLYESGTLSASAATLNPQRAFGADVISRIDSALHGHADELAKTVHTAIAELMTQLCQKANRDPLDIDDVVITGNTTMLYLLTHTDVEPLSHAPFVVSEHFGYSVAAGSLCMPCRADTPVYLPRCISAFVGADITCAVLASGMCRQTQTTLLADIGTNGELALWHHGVLHCCSTAAGPAFEGANLSCGIQGGTGAIDHAAIVDGKIEHHTIGGGAPSGICGSGIADFIACMLQLGLIDESGYLVNEEIYPLTDTIYISQKDIRQIQLAKSAICAGALALLAENGLTPKDVSSFLIAGGFGSYLSLDSAAKIGLIPQPLEQKSRVLGNIALAGAAMLLHNTALHRQTNELSRNAHTVDLASSAAFMDYYVENMQFDQAHPDAMLSQ